MYTWTEGVFWDEMRVSGEWRWKLELVINPRRTHALIARVTVVDPCVCPH